MGAAVISNWDSLFGQAKKSPLLIESPRAKGIVAPHAPPIEVSPSETTVWGEDTKLISLMPGEKSTLDARDLYAVIADFPVSGCVGPAYIIYTWQVRDPYPEGGDLEVRSVVQGGSTDLEGLGAMGLGNMYPCDERIFKNNGLQPMKIEVRYATALTKKP